MMSKSDPESRGDLVSNVRIDSEKGHKRRQRFDRGALPFVLIPTGGVLFGDDLGRSPSGGKRARRGD
jgi:hypothetical protein